MISRTSLAAVAAAVALFAGSALAAKAVVYENAELGIRFSLKKGVGVDASTAALDHILEAAQGKVRLKVIVRKGERIPEAQHQFRLMSYFAGEWQMAEEECRGTGWGGCRSWNWDSEDGKRKGLGMVGYGPGGTYIVVLHGPSGSFKKDRASMRAVQESVQLF